MNSRKAVNLHDSTQRTFEQGSRRGSFNIESVYLDRGNVIPCYRVAEMFGDWIKEYARTRLKDGNDCNAWGDCHERPMIYYLSKSGFMKVVAERNYLLMANEIKEKGISGGLVK